MKSMEEIQLDCFVHLFNAITEAKRNSPPDLDESFNNLLYESVRLFAHHFIQIGKNISDYEMKKESRRND